MFSNSYTKQKILYFLQKYAEILKKIKYKAIYINKTTSLQPNNFSNAFGGQKRQARVLFVQNFKLGISIHYFISVQYQYSYTLVLYKVVLFFVCIYCITAQANERMEIKPKSV